MIRPLMPCQEDCGRRTRSGGLCSPCKEERRRLAAIRRAQRVEDCDQHREHRAQMVEVYRALIQSGFRLFEAAAGKGVQDAR